MKIGDKCRGCGRKAARGLGRESHIAIRHEAGCRFEWTPAAKRHLTGQAFPLEDAA